MIEAYTGQTFYATLDDAPQGLGAQLTVRILSTTGAVVAAASSSAISEIPLTTTSTYIATRSIATPGRYEVVWKNAAADPDVEVTESLTVVQAPSVAAAGFGAMNPTPNSDEIAELRQHLGKTMDVDDELLAVILGATLRFAERYTKRQFHPEPALSAGGVDDQTPVTKVFSTRGKRSVPIPDLRVATAVLLGGSTLTESTDQYVSGYALDRDRDGIATHIELYQPTAYGTGYNDLSITGRWGWASPPSDIKDATLTLAARRFKERDAGFADTVFTAEGSGFTYSRSMPAWVKDVFNSYRIPNFRIA